MTQLRALAKEHMDAPEFAETAADTVRCSRRRYSSTLPDCATFTAPRRHRTVPRGKAFRRAKSRDRSSPRARPARTPGPRSGHHRERPAPQRFARTRETPGARSAGVPAGLHTTRRSTSVSATSAAGGSDPSGRISTAIASWRVVGSSPSSAATTATGGWSILCGISPTDERDNTVARFAVIRRARLGARPAT